MSEGVVKRNPTLDVLFDVLYAASSGACLFALREFLVEELVSIVGVAVVIYVVTKGSNVFGKFISRTFLSRAPFNDPLKSAVTAHKFTAQFWQLVIHVAMTVMEVDLLRHTDWLDRPWRLAPWPKVSDEPELQGMHWLYIVQSAIWIVTCFSHRFIEEKHKDYYVMFAHHVVTISIVAFSLHMGYMRFGLAVFFFHDSSDILLDVIKLLNHLKLCDRAGWFASEVSYVVFMIYWIYQRLFKLPQMIWHGVVCNTILDHRFSDGTFSFATAVNEVHPELMWRDVTVGATVACVLLGALLCMHVWWTALLLRIGYRALFLASESIHDAGKDEYEGQSEDEEPKAPTKPQAKKPRAKKD